MEAKLGSFRYSFAERRERLLSAKGYSELGGFIPVLGDSEEEGEAVRCGCLSFRSLSDKASRSWKTVQDVAYEAWKMGRSDHRKIVFSAKMGLALMLISLLVFLKVPGEEVGRYSVWALLTVVVVFEFSIGIEINFLSGLVYCFYFLFFFILRVSDIRVYVNLFVSRHVIESGSRLC